MTVSTAPHHDSGPDDVDAILAALELDLWASAAARRVRGLRSAADLTRLTPAEIAVDGSAQGIPSGLGHEADSGQMAAESGPVASEGWTP